MESLRGWCLTVRGLAPSWCFGFNLMCKAWSDSVAFDEFGSSLHQLSHFPNFDVLSCQACEEESGHTGFFRFLRGVKREVPNAGARLRFRRISWRSRAGSAQCGRPFEAPT